MRKRLISAALAFVLLPACGNAEASDHLMSDLERLAGQDNAEAIYHIGMAYQTGSGVQKDTTKALAAFRRAAALGDVLASYKLGCYYDGQEGLLSRDPDQALHYKLIAAQAGYALAQQDVAALYASKGETVTAVAWLDKAARQGWPDALATYASVYNGAAGVTPDPVKTAAYFQLFLDRTDASEEQRKWLDTFKQRMTPEQQQLALKIVHTYRAQPTPLTIRALSGQRAAAQLVASKG